jgi:hypothetical protein
MSICVCMQYMQYMVYMLYAVCCITYLLVLVDQVGRAVDAALLRYHPLDTIRQTFRHELFLVVTHIPEEAFHYIEELGLIVSCHIEDLGLIRSCSIDRVGLIVYSTYCHAVLS